MDLTCAELVELVTEYLEGTLAPADCRRFEAHLDDCAHCAEYLEQIRTTVALTGRLREDALRPDAQVALLDAFRSWR